MLELDYIYIYIYIYKEGNNGIVNLTTLKKNSSAWQFVGFVVLHKARDIPNY
jgi:ribosomal protein S11